MGDYVIAILNHPQSSFMKLGLPIANGMMQTNPKWLVNGVVYSIGFIGLSVPIIGWTIGRY